MWNKLCFPPTWLIIILFFFQMSVAQRVFAFLAKQKEPSRPIDIARAIHVSKQEVQRALYHDLEEHVRRTQQVPPLWECATLPSAKQESPSLDKKNVYIMIDLGNVHDCFIPVMKLVKYYQQEQRSDLPTIHVHGYANNTYNGLECASYPQHITKLLQTIHTVMCFELAKLLEQSNKEEQKSMEIYILSKDKGFPALCEYVHEKYPHLTNMMVLTDWSSLCPYLEY